MKEKVGRNPFENGGQSSPKKPKPAPEAVLEAVEEAGPRRKVRSLNWKMDRFAFMRYDHTDDQRRLSLFTLGLKNPDWKRRSHYEVPLVRRGPLLITLVSLRIRSL